jgi:hypothetical protein
VIATFAGARDATEAALDLVDGVDRAQYPALRGRRRRTAIGVVRRGAPRGEMNPSGTRLAGFAGPGQVLVDAGVRWALGAAARVRPLGTIRGEAGSDPVEVFALSGLDRSAGAAVVHLAARR